MEKEFLSTKELAHKLGVAVQTIQNNTYKIPGRIKIGGRVIYRRSDIELGLRRGKLF